MNYQLEREWIRDLGLDFHLGDFRQWLKRLNCESVGSEKKAKMYIHGVVPAVILRGVGRYSSLIVIKANRLGLAIISGVGMGSVILCEV